MKVGDLVVRAWFDPDITYDEGVLKIMETAITNTGEQLIKTWPISGKDGPWDDSYAWYRGWDPVTAEGRRLFKLTP